MMDASATLGERRSLACGGVNAEGEGKATHHFEKFVVEANLMLPSTFVESRPTFFDSRQGIWRTIDFIAIPQAWRNAVVDTDVWGRTPHYDWRTH